MSSAGRPLDGGIEQQEKNFWRDKGTRPGSGDTRGDLSVALASALRVGGIWVPSQTGCSFSHRDGGAAILAGGSRFFQAGFLHLHTSSYLLLFLHEKEDSLS